MTGDQNISVSTSSTQYGTSSPHIVWDRAVLGEGQDTMIWTGMATSSTNDNNKILEMNPDGSSHIIIGAGEYLVYAVATDTETIGAGVLDSFAKGTCQAIWHSN